MTLDHLKPLEKFMIASVELKNDIVTFAQQNWSAELNAFLSKWVG